MKRTCAVALLVLSAVAFGAKPRTAEELAARAGEKRGKGDVKGAIADYTEAIGLYPFKHEWFAARGECKGALGDLRGWLQDVDRAILRNFRVPAYHVARGRALEGLGNSRAAMLEYGRAASLDPDVPAYREEKERISRAREGRLKATSAAAHLECRLGNDRAGEKKHQEAVDHYGKAIALDPTASVYHYAREGERKALKDFAGALTDLDEAIRLEPAQWDYLGERAELKEKLGDLPGALADAKAALALDPRDPDLRNQVVSLGLRIALRNGPAMERYTAAAETRDFSRKMAELGKAIELAPDFSSAYFQRGYARQQQTVVTAERRLAEADYTKAISLNPYRAEFLTSRASLRQSMGEFKGAIADWVAAVELTGDPAHIMDAAGTYIAWRSSGTEGLRDWGGPSPANDLERVNLMACDDAVADDPENVRLRYLRAWHAFQYGITSTALSDLNAALKAEPKNREAAELRAKVVAKDAEDSKRYAEAAAQARARQAEEKAAAAKAPAPSAVSAAPADRICPYCRGTGVGKAVQTTSGVKVGNCTFCNGTGRIK